MALAEPGPGFASGLLQHEQHQPLSITESLFLTLTQRPRAPSCVPGGTIFGETKNMTRADVAQVGVHCKCPLPFCNHAILWAHCIKADPQSHPASPSALGPCPELANPLSFSNKRKHGLMGPTSSSPPPFPLQLHKRVELAPLSPTHQEAGGCELPRL